MLLRRSIRAKLFLLIGVSVGAAVFLSFAVSSWRELSRFGEAKRSELQATADILATSVADAVATGDRAAATRALNTIGRIPDVRFAEIRTASGEIFAEAGAGVALTFDGRAPPAPPSSFWSMLTQGSFFVTTAIIKGGRTLGSLGLLVDTSELADRLKQALFAAAIGAAAAILIGLGIAARLQRSITRPLAHLADTMNRVRATSDFSQRAERRSDDETGQLVDSFNDMIDRIRERDTALEEHRTGLERTVAERTYDLALARDAAESANRAKSDFLATMSHEIRTPMNGMLVMAELLAGTGLPSRQQRYAETIVRSGQTLLTIINDILDLSKIEAGKMDLEQGRVPLATLLDDVLGLFFERAASKNLDLAAHLSAAAPAVIEGDPVRLSQILSNLVNNALKFTEAGYVKVTVEPSAPASDGGASLLFKVEDTGIGIPADKVDKIFEAFSQADQSTTRRYGGTGLGLSICQRLVAAMGGRIWAESTPGKGSTFAFTIEARVLESAAPPQAAAGRSALLGVEGDATRAVLAAALGESGYAARTFAPTNFFADAVFASPEWIEARSRRLSRASRPKVICVAGVGSGKVDRLIERGLADAVLLQPVASPRVREILAAIETGTLAALSETRRAEPVSELADFSGLSVLVADDSPVNREVVTEALSRLRARTTTVENGKEAVAAFEKGRFDIVLMDCSMPEMDGFAATRAIRGLEAEERRERTPVVALTAHVAGGAADDWRDAGMDDYLTKPFTMKSLSECLLRWRKGGVSAADRRGAAAAIEPGEHGVGAQAKDETPALAAPASGPAEESLDPQVLESLRSIAGGNLDMLDRIFGLFRAHAPARLAGLEDALAAGDLPRAASEAHAVKSPSLNIGALKLGALCGEIEAKARSGDSELPKSPLIGRLHAEFEAVLAAIDREREGGRLASPSAPVQVAEASL